MLKPSRWATPRTAAAGRLAEARERAFLTGSQATPLPPVWGPPWRTWAAEVTAAVTGKEVLGTNSY